MGENLSLKQKRQRKYNNSVKGVARQLRSNHGYSVEDSIYIARKCLNDFSTCTICGLPQYFNRTQFSYIKGTDRENRRLCPDRIDLHLPHTLDNTRITCFGCNTLRGAARLSDHEVLAYVNIWYERRYSLKDLWWMNRPGKPGTLFRSIHMERRALKLLDLEGLKELESLHIKIGESTPSIAGSGLNTWGGT